MEEKVLHFGDWWWCNSRFRELRISLLFGFLLWVFLSFPFAGSREMKEEEQTCCYEKRFGDCPSVIRVRKLRVNECFMMVAQRRRRNGVQRVLSWLTVACTGMELKGEVMVVEEDEKRMMKGGNFQF
ncbi:uncharacterized protein HKW66_Vig0009950 [Vigna angularis]|uniref:Uncharacterized protein n=1 Tax=Phaseolus angularis TaxID=3914 RepID=A0A8T0LC18_PHAAN|nr:uncharacterized protein HKW66_Vig0009950 [Vigna angularis]